MSTTLLHQTIAPTYSQKSSVPLVPSFLTKFLAWCKGQEENRLLWLGIILAVHGCILTPMTVMVVLLTGNSLYLFVLATAAMAMALVTNLAALPTKITLPVFALSILIDLAILISCAVLVA